MITLAEIRDGVTASWLMVKGDPEGLRRLNLSEAGFWKSFQLVVPLLPVYAIVIAAQYKVLIAFDPKQTAAPFLLFLAVKLFGQVVNWFGVPLLLAALAGPLGISDRFAPMIIATNWATPLITALPAIAALGYGIGLLSGNAATAIGLIGLFASLFVFYRLTRLSTGCGVQIAIIILLVSLIFVQLVEIVTDHLAG